MPHTCESSDKTKQCHDRISPDSTFFKHLPGCENDFIVLLKTLLEFFLQGTDIKFTTSMIHHLQPFYGMITSAMHIALYLLGTSAVVNLIRSSLIPSCSISRAKREKLVSLYTETKQSPVLDGFDLTRPPPLKPSRTYLNRHSFASCCRRSSWHNIY